MQDSKIIQLLKTLDASEIRLFRKYLRSPIFNYSEPTLHLFEYLRKFHPSYSSATLGRRSVYEKVFPGQAYQDKKLRNLLHEFLSHIEQFLVQLHLRQDDYLRKKLLMEALGRRDLFPLFVQKNRELIQSLEQQSFRDLSTYRELTNLHEQYYFHSSTDKVNEGEALLRSILENMDNYFITNKLRIANEVGARGKIVRQDLPITFIDPILEEVQQNGRHIVLLTFYAALYQLNQTGEETLFQQLKNQLLEQSDALSFSDRQGGLLQLLNYAIRRGNQGDSTFLREAFDLYLYGLDEKLLFQNDKLTDATFTNIAFLGGKIGALDQVAVFIRENVQYLEDGIRTDAETLALAFLYYQKGEFEKVDTLIGNTTFSSTFYRLRARSILTRALFELFLQDESYYDLMLARMEAFEKYLRRKDLSDLQRDPYLGLLKYLRKIGQLIVRRNFYGEDLAKLKKRIEASPSVMNREWLLEQIEEYASS